MGSGSQKSKRPTTTLSSKDLNDVKGRTHSRRRNDSISCSQNDKDGDDDAAHDDDAGDGDDDDGKHDAVDGDGDTDDDEGDVDGDADDDLNGSDEGKKSKKDDKDGEVEKAGKRGVEDEGDGVDAKGGGPSRRVEVAANGVDLEDVTSSGPLLLTKSWKLEAAHVPSYTGGSVTLCHGAGMVPKEGEQQKRQKVPFLLMACAGDLSVVDAQRGVRLGTVRRGRIDPAKMADAQEPEEEDSLADADAITAHALSPDDQVLFTVSRNSVIRRYHVAAAGDDLFQFVTTVGRAAHLLPVTHMAFHSSGVFLATGSVDGIVKVWDVRAHNNGFATHVFRRRQQQQPGDQGKAGAVTCLQWYPSLLSLTLAVGREDGTVVIHDLKQQQPTSDPHASNNVVAFLNHHMSAVTAMLWIPKDPQRSSSQTMTSSTSQHGDVFVTASRDAVLITSVIEQQQQPSGASPKSKKKKTKGTTTATHEETTAYTYRRIGTLPLYEQIEDLQMLDSIPSMEKFNKGALVIATAGSKGVVRLWKAFRNEEKNNDDDKTKTVLSPWQKLTEEPTSTCFGEEGGGYHVLLQVKPVHRLSLNAASPNQLIAVDAEHNFSFLNLPNLNVDKRFIGHNDEIVDLCIVPRAAAALRQEVAVATNGPQIRLFESQVNFACTGSLNGHTDTVLSLSVSPCGRYLASCGKDKVLRLWRLSAKRCIATAVGHTEALTSCALSRKTGRYQTVGSAGAFVVTVSKDRTLKLWNIPVFPEETGGSPEEALVARCSVKAHEKEMNIVAIAPNDSMVASGSQDKTVKLWKAQDLSLIATLRGHKRGVWDCQFSPLDRVIATGSGDRTVKLWSLSDFSCIRTFEGHVGSVVRVRFLAGGLQLLSSGADGLAKVWTIRTNECEVTLDGHTDKVWALDVAADDDSDEAQPSSFVTGGADSRLIVWRDSTKEEDDAKRAAEEEMILLEQRLSNHLQFKEYEKALQIALQLEKPHRALKVLMSIIENDVRNGDDPFETLTRHARSWSKTFLKEKEEDEGRRTLVLVQLLRYCRDWNTRARNSHVAMMVVRAVVGAIPVATLAATEGVPEILAGIVPYAERHFARLDKLYGNSYLMDYALTCMGVLENDDDEDDGRVERSDKSSYALWVSNSKFALPPSSASSGTQGDNDEEDEVMVVGDNGSDSSDADDMDEDSE